MRALGDKQHYDQKHGCPKKPAVELKSASQLLV
jgi:hypothetical protein